MLPFYQNQYSELHCFDTDGINFPPHLHEPIELFYSVNGTAQIQTNRFPQYPARLPNAARRIQFIHSCHLSAGVDRQFYQHAAEAAP